MDPLRFDLLNSYELRDLLGRITRRQKENIVDFFIKQFEAQIDSAYENGKSDGEYSHDDLQYAEDNSWDDGYERGFQDGKAAGEKEAEPDEMNETAKWKRRFYEERYAEKPTVSVRVEGHGGWGAGGGGSEEQRLYREGAGGSGKMVRL